MAWQEHSVHWPELSGADAQQAQHQLVQKMAELSAGLGDAELWQKKPAHMLLIAGVELFGLPKAVDGAAVKAASEAGRKAALSELNAKNSGKAGLAAATGAAKNESPVLTDEEQIMKGIESAFASKMF
jgi:hypothetical protein